jgi:dienelactone hydrolase
MNLRKSFVAAWAAVVALVLSVVFTGAPSAGAADNPFERGPDPTSAILQTTGPFATASTSVSNLSTPGFGSATIYYPTSTAQGTFGGVAISPGFTGTQSSIAWYGPRLASHGFVVITINTNSIFDQPDSRGAQLLAALDYLVNSSSVRTRVDRNRLAVMGHSMGGGGSLRAAANRPALQAAIPLTPWHTDKTWPEVVTPTLIIGAENDSIASVTSHAEPFYNTLSNAADKAYLELNGAGHSAPNSTNATISRFSISWLKRFVDNDTRYDQFLCPPPAFPSSTIQEYRNTCPHA